MFKRILILATGVALGFGLTLATGRLNLAWSIFPNRELNRSTDHLRDVLLMVNEHYVEAQEATFDKLARAAVHSMVESLDPHSEYLEAGAFQDLEEQLSGDFTGIGIQVEMRKNRVWVIAPIANSPGERAGILRGDEIIGVDGKGVEGEATLTGVVDRLRGKPGTRVAVDFFRPSTGLKFQAVLQREVIKMESVRGVRMLSEQTGYILLTEFSDHTSEEFGQALDRLLKEGADSLVLDLRNNPGGLLESAVAVAEPFFAKGELIVSTRGRKREDTEELRAEAEGDPLSIPMVVLINGGTASAAEVVTGALQDTRRAIVLGERSFGKGSVQSIFEMKNGEGLRLTTAKYFTPSGVSIHERGIEPDIAVVMSAEEDSKLRVQQTRTDIVDPREFEERFGFRPIEDRQLQAAIEVLKGLRRLEEQASAVGTH